MTGPPGMPSCTGYGQDAIFDRISKNFRECRALAGLPVVQSQFSQWLLRSFKTHWVSYIDPPRVIFGSLVHHFSLWLRLFRTSKICKHHSKLCTIEPSYSGEMTLSLTFLIFCYYFSQLWAQWWSLFSETSSTACSQPLLFRELGNLAKIYRQLSVQGRGGFEEAFLQFLSPRRFWIMNPVSPHNQCERINQLQGQRFFKRHQKMLIIHNLLMVWQIRWQR